MFVFVFKGECLKMDKYYFCLVRDLEGKNNTYKGCFVFYTVESSLFFLPNKKKTHQNPTEKERKPNCGGCSEAKLKSISDHGRRTV